MTSVYSIMEKHQVQLDGPTTWRQDEAQNCSRRDGLWKMPALRYNQGQIRDSHRNSFARLDQHSDINSDINSDISLWSNEQPDEKPETHRFSIPSHHSELRPRQVDVIVERSLEAVWNVAHLRALACCTVAHDLKTD